MKRILAVPLALLLAGCATSGIGRAPAVSEIAMPVQPPASAPAMRQQSTTGTSASLWRSGPQSLFGDRRARGLGDILTVVVEIDESAEMRNSTSRARDGSEAFAAPSFPGLDSVADAVFPGAGVLAAGIDAGSSSATSGTGTTRRNERLTLRVAATVREVLPNGHLVVEGRQEVRVNYELRDLQIVGIVRPEDINRGNEITYDRIAEARIVYGGRGQITDLQQPRYGQQILERILPF
ncbi:MAG: flagellar basal body L-ring protein FlgH [Rubricella sp.]